MIEVDGKCTVDALLVEKNKNVQLNIDIVNDAKGTQKVFLGKRVGDLVVIHNGKLTYKIINIRPYNPSSIKAGLSDSEKLINKMRRYGFRGFVHTTEIENFRKILKYGYLYPRNELKKLNVNFIDKADQEIISNTKTNVKDCCRFYYATRTPTNFKAEYVHPVTIFFDEALIDDFRDKLLFSPINAACKDSKVTRSIAQAINFDWKGIFERGPHCKSKFYNIVNVDASKTLINRIRNAEFLIEDKVPISYIKKIVVKYEEDAKIIKTICDKTVVINRGDFFD